MVDRHAPVDDERRNLVHAAVQKPGDPSTKRDKTWGAHERIGVKRASAEGDKR